MTLLDIVKELDWPDDAEFVAQDSTLTIYGFECEPTIRTSLIAIGKQVWLDNTDAGFLSSIWDVNILADDYRTAIITHAEYLQARAGMDENQSDDHSMTLQERYDWLWKNAVIHVDITDEPISCYHGHSADSRAMIEALMKKDIK